MAVVEKMPHTRAGIGLMATALVCALMLILPGRTVTAAFTNDVLIFLDGAHRIEWGQLPNRDFHTALGPVVFYIPAIGLWLTDNLGAAMPVGMAVLLLAMSGLMIRILQSRLRPWLALGLGTFLMLILAAPVNLGSPIWHLSFAMFYNRIGWVSLALLLVMYLQPKSGSATGGPADALASALLLLLQFYTKVTYGLVGLGFLLFMLFDRHQRRWVSGSLLIAAVGAVFIESAWGASWLYFLDLADAAHVSGRRDFLSLMRSGLNNLADLTVFAIAVAVVLWRTCSIRDVLFYGFCAAAGLLILNQNAHGWGIITLYSGVAVATETALRFRSQMAPPTRGMRLPSVEGMPLLFAFFLLPPIVYHASVLTLHAGLASANAGVPLGLPKFEDLRVLSPQSSPEAFMTRYHESIASGGRLLQSLSTQPERVVVLDFVNPFSAGLGLRPPAGDSSWLHWGRNVDEKTHLPPEVLLADAKLVMVPKIGINSVPLQQIYGPFISRKFDLLEENGTWRLYTRRQMGDLAP